MTQLKRHRDVMGLFIFVTLLLSSLFQSQDAYAGVKKISGTGKSTAVVSETKMYPEDVPGHEVTLINFLGLDNSADPDFKTSQVNSVGISDLIAGTGTDKGYRAVTHPGGDKTFASYEGTSKTVTKSDGSSDTTFEGTWWFTGGTGKFKGISGGGTYNGKTTREGYTYEWEGEYDIK